MQMLYWGCQNICTTHLAYIFLTVDSHPLPSEWEGNSQLGLPVRGLHQITFLHQIFSGEKNTSRSGRLRQTEEKTFKYMLGHKNYENVSKWYSQEE